VDTTPRSLWGRKEGVSTGGAGRVPRGLTPKRFTLDTALYGARPDRSGAVGNRLRDSPLPGAAVHHSVHRRVFRTLGGSPRSRDCSGTRPVGDQGQASDRRRQPPPAGVPSSAHTRASLRGPESRLIVTGSGLVCSEALAVREGGIGIQGEVVDGLRSVVGARSEPVCGCTRHRVTPGREPDLALRASRSGGVRETGRQDSRHLWPHSTQVNSRTS
jgi:hypothetical protein